MKKLLYDIILSNELLYNSKTFSRYQHLIGDNYCKSSLNCTCPELNLVREIVCRKRKRSWISGRLDAPGISVNLNLTFHKIDAIAHTPTASSFGQPLKLAEYESVRREFERQEDAGASIAALAPDKQQAAQEMEHMRREQWVRDHPPIPPNPSSYSVASPACTTHSGSALSDAVA